MVIPTVPGRHVREVHTFAPAASSKLQEIAAYFRGDHPQFYDAKFVAKSEGREGAWLVYRLPSLELGPSQPCA